MNWINSFDLDKCLCSYSFLKFTCFISTTAVFESSHQIRSVVREAFLRSNSDISAQVESKLIRAKLFCLLSTGGKQRYRTYDNGAVGLED